DHNTVLYHMRVLQGFGLIKLASGSANRFVPTGKLSAAEEARSVGPLANPSAKSIHDHLAARGPRDMASLAQEIGLGYSTVAALVSTLRTSGLVERRRVGKRWVVGAVPTDGRTQAPFEPR